MNSFYKFFPHLKATMYFYDMHNYDTITAALADLDKRGYVNDFNLAAHSIECKSLDLHLRPEQFEIDEVYRFEGMTDPGDSSVIYAISSTDNSLKGVIVDAYGVYANVVSPELLAKLSMHHQ